MQKTTFNRAREIIGGRCIGPDIISSAAPEIGLTGTSQDWSAVPFSKEMLSRASATHLLIAGFPLSMMDIDAIYPDFFISGYRNFHIGGKMTYWFANQDFAAHQRVQQRWYLMRTDPVPGSFCADHVDKNNLTLSAKHGLNFEEQLRLLKSWETVPHACEVAYLALICKLLWGQNLFQHYVRTCNDIQNGTGNIVLGYIEQHELTTGALYRIGMDVDEMHRDDHRPRVGLASEIIPLN